jgi:hypothetical protein
VERQQVIERKAASSKVMSEVQKQKQHPIPLRSEAQLKAKALRFQPATIVGALEPPSRVKMNAQKRRP